ncbi:hypothetical protein [Ensifer adhaerens]|uniref:hypothetical protein n=1 Tax=Ensifer adhaerens TaxID=106592 RepID=UPI001C4DEF1C|nr:hypothetical protein [Ensifer adhaerens]MBW0368277.1 hypothetical protein [Ensifer adhaerens]UCM24981.1 hypothetical protein LDL63_34915 [Ensifer adhaerens]
MFNDRYSAYGNIGVAECFTENNVSISADIAIIALGWETRCVALERHVSLSIKQLLVLDFALPESGDLAIEESRRRLREVAARCGAELTELALQPSVDYQRNINTLQMTLAELGRRIGSYHGTLRRVFVDCSTMPRIYMQWLIAYGLGGGAIHAIDFGYAEGSYEKGDDPAVFSSLVDRYETVPLLEGSGGMGEEKLLLVGLGGDADMFYGLVNEFSPERVAVLVPRSDLHSEVDLLLNQQVAKVKEMYRLEDGEVSDVPAFSLFSHLDVFRGYVTGVGEHAVISVFVGGPKVQAIASAVFACSDKRVQVKARIPKQYPRREVPANGRYHIYRLIDLTSPACSLPDTW